LCGGACCTILSLARVYGIKQAIDDGFEPPTTGLGTARAQCESAEGRQRQLRVGCVS